MLSVTDGRGKRETEDCPWKSTPVWLEVIPRVELAVQLPSTVKDDPLDIWMILFAWKVEVNPDNPFIEFIDVATRLARLVPVCIPEVMLAV